MQNVVLKNKDFNNDININNIHIALLIIEPHDATFCVTSSTVARKPEKNTALSRPRLIFHF